MIGIIQSIMITAFLNYGLIDREEIEAYKFGIECYILKIIHFGTYILGAVFLKSLFEFLAFFVSYSLLRKYAGGIHANTRRMCLILSNIIIFFLLVFGQKIEYGIILYFLSIISLVIIMILGPVANPNRKPFLKEKKKNKKNIIYICLIEIIAINIFKECDFLKWMQIGAIVSAVVAIAGKIKYDLVFQNNI